MFVILSACKIKEKYILGVLVYRLVCEGRSNSWAPLETYPLKFFGLVQGWRTLLRARAHIANNFRRNSFACGNLSLLTPLFRLF